MAKLSGSIHSFINRVAGKQQRLIGVSTVAAQCDLAVQQSSTLQKNSLSNERFND